MKMFLFLPQIVSLFMLACFGVSAGAWETLVSCDNGSLIVERQCLSAGRQYSGEPCRREKVQMVIRNSEVQNYFASIRAFGSFKHPGQNLGYHAKDRHEMIIRIDGGIYNWGMRGNYYYQLDIPFHDDQVRISYYLNYWQDDPSSLTVKAYAHKSSVFDLIRPGDLGHWNYHGCYIKR